MGLNTNQEIIKEKVKLTNAQGRKNGSTHRNFILMFSKLICLIKKWCVEWKDSQAQNQQLNEHLIQTTQRRNECDDTLACRKWQVSCDERSQSNVADGSSNSSNSHYLAKQSISLYATSSLLFGLCFFATTASAIIENPVHPV